MSQKNRLDAIMLITGYFIVVAQKDGKTSLPPYNLHPDGCT